MVTTLLPVEPEAVLDLVRPGADLVVPLANGEPTAVLDALEAGADALQQVRVHQMHALHDRPYLHGAFGDRLRHVSYFLSHVTRPAYWEGTIDLVPNHFSEVPLLLERGTTAPVVLAAASEPDRHGYFSLGTNADYVARLIGRVPFFLEATPHMPRTRGANAIHHSQVAGWCRSDRPLVEVPRAEPTARRPGHRRARGRAHPRRGHHPDRHRRHLGGRARRLRATTATWASTPSCSTTAWSTWWRPAS